MNRIISKFSEIKRNGQKALIGYLTAGDPDLRTSEKYMRTALKNGVDILEVGVPFSDPTADGPTIQKAGARALASGTNLRNILKMIKRLRHSFETPIILFSYANPLFSYGYDRICADAVSAGVDGFLVVDMPFEESGELRVYLKRHGLLFIHLIAPTTSQARIEALLSQADGFVYYIMIKGVTGQRDSLAPDIRKHIAQVRSCTRIPVAVGFGISNRQQARKAGRYADAVVVGSALVKAARSSRLAGLVRELAAALHN